MILPKVRDPRLITLRRVRRRVGDGGGTRELVLEDQRVRNEICWSVFDC